jgi:hypothetical protein
MGGMTDAEQQQSQPQPELAEIADQAGECLACGAKPTRVVSRYPGKATVADDEGHQWDVDLPD